jgi:hypothetical protein
MVKGKHPNNRMLFHNAVMRWKCSLLNEDEKRDLQEWIDNDTQERLEAVQCPWKTSQATGMDDLTAENQYVQK